MFNSEEYKFVKRIKSNEKSEIILLEHKTSGVRIIKRTFYGNPEVYKALLNHRIESIPKIFHVNENNNKVIVFEEYIDGITLSELLQEELYNEKSVRKIICELCDTLAILHGHNIIHRDIKPENIMIDKKQNFKLIDFDSARIYKPYYPKDTEYLGTVGYAAPEQYGDTQTDSRTDIYSVGVLMNVLLTGKPPTVQLYGGDMGKVIEKCIQVNPGKRFQTAEELKKAMIGNKKRKKNWRYLFPLVILFPVVICVTVLMSNDESDNKTKNSDTLNSLVETTDTPINSTDDVTTAQTSAIKTTSQVQTSTTIAMETTSKAQASTTIAMETTSQETVIQLSDYITEGKTTSQIQGYGGYEDIGGIILTIEEINETTLTFSIVQYSESSYAADTISARNITAEITDNKAEFHFLDAIDGNGMGTLTFENGKIHIVTYPDETASIQTSIIIDEWLIIDEGLFYCSPN